MQERFTVPLALEIGVASIVRWKHTRLMVCYRPTRGVVTTEQTSPDAQTSSHSHQPKSVTGLEMLTFPFWAAKESVRVPVLKLFSYI
jgi:hypothetical protein